LKTTHNIHKLAKLCSYIVLIALCQSPSFLNARQIERESYKWWTNAKFGIFIHWNMASALALGAGSWFRQDEPNKNSHTRGYNLWQETLPTEIENGDYLNYWRSPNVPMFIYDNLYQIFNPTEFDADDIVSNIKGSGAKYLIFTTKHHDGFCMFDTKYTDSSGDYTEYDIMMTPYGQDICKKFADACHEQDVRVMWYYSIPDWFQDFYDYNDLHEYLPYLKHQVLELMDEDTYGKIDGFWWDGYIDLGSNFTQHLWDDMLKINPDLISNNRMLSLPGVSFKTPEQKLGAFNMNLWESCITMQGEGWFYNDNLDVMDPEACIKLLINCVIGDGNLALDIPIDQYGKLSDEVIESLAGIGKWLEVNGESVYNTRGGPYKPCIWGGSTRKGNKIYLHIFENLPYGRMTIPALPENVNITDAYLLKSGEKVNILKNSKKITISMDPASKDNVDTVIVLETDTDTMNINPISPFFFSFQLSQTYDATVTASSTKYNTYQHSLPEAVVLHKWEVRGTPPPTGQEELRNADYGSLWRSWFAKDHRTTPQWLKVDFGSSKEVKYIVLQEHWNHIKDFYLQYEKNGDWVDIYHGNKVNFLTYELPETITTSKLRLLINDWKTENCEYESPGIKQFNAYPPMYIDTKQPNLALDGQAEQISTFSNYTADFAIDGQMQSSQTKGNSSLGDWWQLDLGHSEDIESIHIYPTHSLYNHLQNFYIFISDAPFISDDPDIVKNRTDIKSFFISSKVNDDKEFTINEQGRYIRIQLTAENTFLEIVEVQVFPRKNTPPTVKIDTPDNNDVYKVGSDITFTASAFDVEDGKLPATNMLWTSSLDGEMGNSDALTISNLQPGKHIINIIASDSEGSSTVDSRIITILPTYSLTVDNGSGTGKYAENSKIQITAIAKPTQIFQEWSGDIQYIDDAYSKTATVTMPAKAIVLTPIFRRNPNMHTISGSITGDLQQGTIITLDTGQSVEVEPDGKYIIDGVLNGTYTVTPSINDAYSFIPTEKSVVIEDNDVTDIDFICSSRPTYSVSIVNGKGGGDYLEGAVIEIIPDNPPNGEMFDCWIGDIQFLENDPKLAVNSLTVPPRTTTLEAKFKTIPVDTFAISGTVTGDIAENVFITLSGDTIRNLKTDQDGNYSFQGIPHGDYTVTATCDKYKFSPESISVTIADKNVDNINFSSEHITYSLTGVILNSQGVPLEGVLVTLDSGENALTDKEGAFTIIDVSNGNYEITPELRGYSFSPINKAISVEDDNISNIEFTGSPLPTYSITVLNGKGGGDYLEDAVIEIIPNNPPNGKMFDCWIGDIQFLENDPKLAVNSLTVPPRTTTLEAKFKTIPPDTFAISGTVTGDIAENVFITLSGDMDQIIKTDQDGNYSFQGVLHGDYTVTATCDKYKFSPETNPVTVYDKNVDNVNFSAELTTYSITGMILDTQGIPLEGVSILLDSGAYTLTDYNGMFSISSLRNGTYVITPNMHGYSFSPVDKSAIIANDNISGIKFTAALLPTYSVSIVNGKGGGDYLENETVNILAEAPPDGEMFDCWIGDIQFLENDPKLAINSLTVPPQSITIEAKFKTIPVDTFAISGTVTGDIAENVFITLSGDADQIIKTDQDGNYSFQGVPHGDYTVTATCDKYKFSPENISVTIVDKNETNVNFSAELITYSITGMILDTQGMPLEGVSISLDFEENTSTDPNGSFSISGLPDGNYVLAPSLRGYSFSPINKSVTITDKNVDQVNFSAELTTYSITGTILDFNNEPLRGVSISLDSGEKSSTDAIGSFSISGLSNGEYTLTPVLKGYSFSPINNTVKIEYDDINIDFRANCIPIANDDSFSFLTNTSLNISTPGILANDIDNDNQTLTVTVKQQPRNGKLTLNANGSFSYVPRPEFIGDDSFTYIINDSIDNSNEATVEISVKAIPNHPPVALSDSYTVETGHTLKVSLENGVLANDIDEDEDKLQVYLHAPPRNGSLTINKNGSFTYTPKVNFAGIDKFSYFVKDETDSSNIATVKITTTFQKVTIGTLISIAPSQIEGISKLSTFEKTPKIYAIIGRKKLGLKKDNSSSNNTANAIWKKRYSLISKIKKSFASAINGRKQEQIAQLKIKTKIAGNKIDANAQKIVLVPPEIESVALNGATLVIKGKYFGSDIPKIALESKSKGNLIKCKADSKGYFFDPATGRSMVTVTFKRKKVSTGEYWLILDNKIGIGVNNKTKAKWQLPLIYIKQ